MGIFDLEEKILSFSSAISLSSGWKMHWSGLNFGWAKVLLRLQKKINNIIAILTFISWDLLRTIKLGKFNQSGISNLKIWIFLKSRKSDFVKNCYKTCLCEVFLKLMCQNHTEAIIIQWTSVPDLFWNWWIGLFVYIWIYEYQIKVTF